MRLIIGRPLCGFAFRLGEVSDGPKRRAADLALCLCLLLMVVLSSGCAHTPRADLHAQLAPAPIAITVRAPCPSPAERARLAALRPKPLRVTPEPATTAERVAKSVAQLGRYESSGAWADQVDAALDRCQRAP